MLKNLTESATSVVGILGIILASLLGLVALVLLFWQVWFLRTPPREIPSKGIVSPAYGKITRIIPYKNGKAQQIPKGLWGKVHTLTNDVAKEGYLIVIMLSPLDVHYQRAPIAGTITYSRHTQGKFGNAVFGAGKTGAFENEKNEILIVGKGMRAKVVQVAGFVARRIQPSVTKGQTVEKGELIGRINLGSQVQLIIPKRKLFVRVGMRVVEGETVIA